MKQFSYVVTDELGIHARPAGELVKLAKTFTCSVKIEKDGRSVDGKRLLAVMSLGAKQGHKITVTCEGDEEEQASTTLEDFLKKNL
jgi:phosphocarrier protein HPr